ncbi:MAG: DNA repair protein RadC [Theionarchaea archaeon]|nr:DNA repair protein RadC [Theionarchaea archaeon]
MKRQYKDGCLFEEKKIDRDISVKGAECSTNQELLAVIMSGDMEALTAAVNLLNTFQGNLVHLFCASVRRLMETDGIGFQEACKIKATFKLTKRIAAYCEEERPKIASKDDVTKILAPHMMFLRQEEFRVMLLNAKQKLIWVETISLGSLDKALVEPRDVFRPAITFNAASLVIVHNHPSGDTHPSEQDVLLTRELCMYGIILGIEVLDHIIIGVRDHVSFRERG